MRLNQWIGMLMCLMVFTLASGAQAQERVAVLELTNASTLSSGTMNYVTQRVRGVVAEELGGKFQVLTKENILRLVDEQTCDDAAGASCEVEVAKKLGSHYVITGSITKVGKRMRMVLKVHKTSTAQLLGAPPSDLFIFWCLVGIGFHFFLPDSLKFCTPFLD